MTFFSANVKYLRLLKGLKQSQMLEEVEVNRTTWNNYEKGVSTPNVEGLIKIAKYFGVGESAILHINLPDLGVSPQNALNIEGDLNIKDLDPIYRTKAESFAQLANSQKITIESLQALIAVKDEEIARLQKQLSSKEN
ncbi:helix-turn-helix transcriptional regulator [Chitinophagaceae bacterium LWZ2-11]